MADPEKGLSDSSKSMEWTGISLSIKSKMILQGPETHTSHWGADRGIQSGWPKTGSNRAQHTADIVGDFLHFCLILMYFGGF